MAHIWQGADVQVLENHLGPLLRWADAAPRRRDGCLPVSALMVSSALQILLESIGSGEAWHRDAYDIMMCTIRSHVHESTEKACG